VENLTGNADFDGYFISMYLYDMTTNTTQVLLQSDGRTTSYTCEAVSKDGKTAYCSAGTITQTSFGANYHDILYSLDLETGALTKLSVIPPYSGADDAEDLLDEFRPDVSDDNSFIVFESNRDDLLYESGSSSIYKMSLTDFTVERIPNTPPDAFRARISPDGTKLALTAYDGDWEIYIMGIDGTEVEKITSNSAPDRFPAWSPDGTKIVYHSDRNGNLELYLYDLVSGETTRLTVNSASDATADFSPDGTKILFYSDRDGDFDFYVLDLDTLFVTQASNLEGEQGVGLWVP